jgi:hypothetical protein
LKGIINDDTIKKSQWDTKVYQEVARILGYNIFPLVDLLKRVIDAKDYNHNFGIYKELVLSNGGLPEFFSYRQLFDDKNVAGQRMKHILDSESASSKEDLAKKWIRIANNDMLMHNDEKRKYLLETIPDKSQAIEFYERLKEKEIFDINNPMNRLSINDIHIHIDSMGGYRNENSKGYFLSWFNYVTGFGVWNIYVAYVEELKVIERKGLLNSLTKDETINIFSNSDGMSLFRKFLEDHMNSGAFFLARNMDKTFKTIYPKRISFFQFGPMLTNGLCNPSLSHLFNENPDAYFLTAIREDIENGGLCDKEDSIEKMIGTKCIWNTNKIIEQRFGVCSKELEMSLKTFIKFPNMRFYN